ncbi:DNA-binding transcriptional LysR family regulator [Variovorax beijingensis]|uniref:DNA-binding transcriptional LysR family regulator n=1 Tax=Variovorax beijingensis TaxID=2496117 RepID=A0A561C6N6_9BURK|nr:MULTISPECIES: LysR family transcriptional regulator [Variovorax]MDR6453716.1 DNA-binding transcriptional LysR family regulator [Variovorax paradoxus]TWD86532.1 DNA-binding transcriptional LysR family regulator [Variovorax beijingensis]
MQDLNDMVFFAEVAERGGFAAASRALGIPKSRLSRRVAELEDRLGVQLMQRSTRRLSLTPAGEIFLRHSAAVRDAAQAATEAVAQVHTEPCGTVRLSCPITIAHSGLAQLLPRFMERYPAVRVDLRVMNRPVDLIEEGIDIALRVRPAIEDSTTLVAKVLGTSRAVLVARPELLQRLGPVRTPDDLARLPTTAMSANAEGRSEWRLEGPKGEIHVHVHTPRCVADDLATLQLVALEGVGATLLPGYMCRADVEAGRLAQVLPGWGPAPVIAHMVFPPRRALVPAVRQLIDFLTEHMSGSQSGMY